MKNKSKQSKQTKHLVADKSPERLKRLKALSERLHGKFKNFMRQEELKKMREDDKWKVIHQMRGPMKARVNYRTK
jgi:hypothetical protein